MTELNANLAASTEVLTLLGSNEELTTAGRLLE